MNYKVEDIKDLLNLSHINCFIWEKDEKAPYHLPKMVTTLFKETDSKVLLIQFNNVLLFSQLKIDDTESLVIGPITTQDLYYEQPFEAFSYLKNSNKYVHIKNITDHQANFKIEDFRALIHKVSLLLFKEEPEITILKRKYYGDKKNLLETQSELDTSFKAFTSAVYHGDKDRFIKLLRDPHVYLNSFIHDGQTSKEDLKRAFYRCFVTTSNLAAKQGINRKDLEPIQTKYSKILENNYDDPIKAGHIMVNTILEITDKIREKRFFNNDDPLIKRVYDYVNANYQTPLTRNMIAEKINVSPTYLSMYFKKKTGQNLSHFIQTYKVNKAEMLLEDQSMSIIEISNYLGFNNVTYFNRIFKKITGQTPSAYRKNH